MASETKDYDSEEELNGAYDEQHKLENSHAWGLGRFRGWSGDYLCWASAL
jgi:hypothetical protein